MPGIRELLQRFRPAGTPGGVGGAGVPADRDARLAAELAPVFDALAAAHAEAAAVRADAAERAAAIRRAAADTRDRVLRGAQEAAAATRSDVSTAALVRARADVEAMGDTGAGGPGDDRVDHVVALVVKTALETLYRGLP